MEPIVRHLPFELSEEQLIKKLHLQQDSPYLNRVRELAEEARKIAKPKAIFKHSYVESREENVVTIDGLQFQSQILSVNLEKTHRVFPFVVTCGRELAEWGQSITDVLENYCADTIQEMILKSARKNFTSTLDEECGLSSASEMYPGSLSDWPITEQRPLFQLLGNVTELIGVDLTDSFLLFPVKTVSGIRFPGESTFQSCQLCPREKCPNRSARYDPELKMKYQTHVEG